MNIREKIEAALAKPLPDRGYIGEEGRFDPWEDVIRGVYGGYSSGCDALMIAALEAVRDRKTFELIDQRGFAAEFILYLLAGHGLTDYGTSPRGGWPGHHIEDLWQPLIDKWKAYSAINWDTPEDQQ